jgi:hypothetical protein
MLSVSKRAALMLALIVLPYAGVRAGDSPERSLRARASPPDARRRGQCRRQHRGDHYINFG